MLGAAGLLLASCSQDNLVSGVGNGDGTSTITMNLSMPEINTRAYGDGTTATKLMYAVYEVKSDNSLSQIEGSEYAVTDKANAEEIKISKAKTFTLLNDKKYKFVFWAEAAGETPYSLTWGANDIKLSADYSNVTANNENLDAFYGTVDLTVKGNVQMDVPLYRPFAQINIGTNDLTKAENLGYVVTKSMVKAQSHSSMNLLDGTCDTNTPATMTFKMNDIPSGETFPVEDYEYLAMTYVLVPADKENISVSFDYMDATEGEGKHIHNVSNVPVKRNHRTNIYGQVLTGNAELTVRIEPIFDTPDLEPNPLELAAAIGGTVVLDDDVNFDDLGWDQLRFEKDVVLDLNGKTIIGKTGNSQSDNADGTILAVNGSTMTIKGPGEVKANGSYATIVVWADEGSTINIEGGTFDGVNDDVTIYIGAGGGTINIKGGVFKGLKPNSKENLLNCYDAAFKNGSAKFVVTGGTFYNWDPRASTIEPTYPEKVNWVADGYKVIVSNDDEGNTLYTVVENNVVDKASDFLTLYGASNEPIVQVYANTTIDLTEATADQLTNNVPKTIIMQEGSEIKMGAQKYFAANADLTIIGPENSIKTRSGELETTGAVITNADTPINGKYKALIHIYDGTLTLKNVTLVCDLKNHYHTSGVSNGAAISYYKNSNVVIEDSRIYSGEYTLCGLSTMGEATGEITLTNSYFESTSANTNGTGAYSYALRIFGKKATVTNCEVKGIQGGIALSFVDLTINGGKYYTYNTPGNNDGFYPVYATNNGTVTILDGEFSSPNDRSNGIAEGKSAVVCGDDDTGKPFGNVIIKGGKFSGKAYNHVTNKIYEPAAGFSWTSLSDQGEFKWTVK